MPSSDPHARAGRGGVMFALTLAFALWAFPALGTEVFHSPNDDGMQAGGSPTIAAGGTQPVYLYVDGGSTASTPGSPCHDGSGDEVCGFRVTLSGAGGLTIASFTPDGSADVVANESPASIVINGLDPVAPGTGPQRIGVLNVNAATGGSVQLDSGEVIGASLASESLVGGTIVTVPEPTALAMWAAGASMLVLISKGRARR